MSNEHAGHQEEQEEEVVPCIDGSRLMDSAKRWKQEVGITLPPRLDRSVRRRKKPTAPSSTRRRDWMHASGRGRGSGEEKRARIREQELREFCNRLEKEVRVRLRGQRLALTSVLLAIAEEKRAAELREAILILTIMYHQGGKGRKARRRRQRSGAPLQAQLRGTFHDLMNLVHEDSWVRAA